MSDQPKFASPEQSSTCSCNRCRPGVGQRRATEAQKRKWWQDFRAADDAVRKEGLRRVPIRGDNNCQFRALAAFFEHKSVTHEAIRALIVDYIEQHKEIFRIDVEQGLGWPSIERYCAQMRVLGTWGDGVTLTAFCLSQDVNIVVFTEGGRTELYPGDGRPMLGLVCVGEHYEATRVVDEPDAANGDPCVQNHAQMSANMKNQ